MNFTSKSIYIAVLLFVSASAFKIQQKNSRILNGYPSEKRQFPYFVYLEAIVMSENKINGCGGSLISDEWVLTAAHCFMNASVMRIHLGTLRILEIYEPGRMVIAVGQKHFFPHPDFEFEGIKNDIGLLRLPKRIPFTPNIRKVNLPTTCDLNEHSFVVTIGNGLVDVKSKELSKILQWAPFKIISREKCNEKFKFLDNRKTVICINSPKDVGSSVCNGDSGGPLIKFFDGTLIGVASFVSNKGCDKGFPQVFTSIVEYHPWISRITGLDLITC